MGIRIREVTTVSILDIDGKININSSDIIETVGWLTSTGKINILLNLENVDIVDYSGLSILAIAYKNVVNHKGKLKFLNVSLPIAELFKVVKLDGTFESYFDEEEAVNSFFEESAGHLLLRRRFKRLDINLSVKYRLVSDQKKPKIFDGKAVNLSAAGVYIYTPYILPINSLLDTEIALNNTPKKLEVTGRVVWNADKELQPHHYPGMGVGFIHLDHDKEKMIIDFIDKNITHRAEPL